MYHYIPNIPTYILCLRPQKPFAFNMFIGGGYRLVERFFLEQEKCGLQEIQYLQENKPWLTCRKHSPFTEIYKVG